MKRKKTILFGLAAVGLITLIFGGTAKAESGVVDIDAFLNSTKGVDTARGVHYPGYSDNFVPGEDYASSPTPEGRHNVTLRVDGVDACYDVRSEDCNTPFNIKVLYNGTIAIGEEPNIVIEISFPYSSYIFGNESIILTQEDSNGTNEPNGYREDARAEIDYGSGLAHIDFGKLPAGTYTPDTPFLYLRVDFEKLIADLNNDNTVNFKDYAVMAQYWGKEGRYIADISGPDGIPDLIVGTCDLAKLVEQWLSIVYPP
jgi:hypothetical protein